MNKFDETYTELMEMIAGPGGAFGDLGGAEYGGALGNSDFYAPGDARVPKVLGANTVKKKKKKKKKNSKIKRDGKKINQTTDDVVEMNIQRRVFPNM